MIFNRMIRKLVLILLIALGLLLQGSQSALHALELSPGGLIPVSLPMGYSRVSPVLKADLDGDGTLESLELAGKRLSIVSAGTTAWQSPNDWQVTQAAVGDLNLDGQPEVILLLWRPFRPWPVDQWLPNGGRISAFHDRQGLSCHIILVGWRGAGYHELWAGSPMADPIYSFAVADLDGDQNQELVAVEGRYNESRSRPARTLKVWKWNGFGFSVVSSMDGIFNEFTLIKANNDHILILVP